MPTTSEGTTVGTITAALSSASTTASKSTTAESTTTAPSATSLTMSNLTNSAAATSDPTTISTTKMPTTSEITTAKSTTTVSSTASTTLSNPTTSAAATSDSTTLSTTTMPTTSEITTARATTTVSSTASTTLNNPITSAAVTSEPTTPTSKTMPTTSEGTTVRTTTAALSSSSITASKSTPAESTTTAPSATSLTMSNSAAATSVPTAISTTTIPTTSEITTAKATITALSTASTTLRNPTTATSAISESTAITSTTMSTDSGITTVKTTASTTAAVSSTITTVPVSSEALSTTASQTKLLLATTSTGTLASAVVTSEVTASGSTTTPAASTTAASMTTVGPSTTVTTASETKTASSTSTLSSPAIVPSTATASPTSSESPLQTTSIFVNPAPVKSTTLESTTAHTASTSATTKLPSTVTSAATSSEAPSTKTAETTISFAATTTETSTLASLPMSTTSGSTPAPAASSFTSSSSMIGAPTAFSSSISSQTTSTTIQGPTISTITARTSAISSTTENPAQTAASILSTSTATVATTTAFQITSSPLSSTTVAFTNTAPTLSQATLPTTTNAPPIITTVSLETITVAVTIMPMSSSHVTIFPTLTPTKTTEPPRTSNAPITTMTVLPTNTVPVDISATAPSTTSSAAAQMTTAFQVTTGDLLKTTVAFTSTSSAPATLELSTKTTSSPSMDSETTTASTTTTGIITGLANTAEFPVAPITLGSNTNTSTSPSSTVLGQTFIKTTPVETPISNTTTLNNTTKADAFVTFQSTSNPETSNISKTLASNVSGAATVTTKLIFSNLSSLPTETLVQGAISTLITSRESQLNESLQIVSFIYQKISETSYAVIFTIILNNVSIPKDPELRNKSYVQVQDLINNALNTLLNEPGKQDFEPKSSNFTSTSNQIDGRMEYVFQNGDAIQPVSFLNELRVSTTTTVLPETTTSFSVTSPNLMSGSAVVTARLVFNSSSPVPSEDLVLRAINTLRISRESKLNESVKVVNVTYEKISETSYAVVFEIRVVNISMPVDQVLRNNTYQEVQKIIVTTLNTLLNEPGSPPLEPKFSNFTSATNQIDGKIGYNFNGGDAMQPVSFLNELRVSTTTTVLPETTTSFFVTSPNLMSGSAVVIARLVFNSSSPVPSEDLVLRAINTLRNSRESKLNESVKVVNVTYEKISETSYAVVFEIRVVNISMPVDQVLRNNTYQEVQKIIVTTLNTLLNEPGSPPLEPKFSNFTSATNQIDGKIGYNFNGGDAMQPVSFLNELRVSTTTTVLPETTTSFFVTSPNLMSGSAVVIARLVFNSSSPVPSEDLVLRAINTLRNSRESKLNESVKVVNVTYEKISETSYAVVFEIRVVNISMPVDQVLRNNTYQEVQKIIVTTLNTLLNEPGSPPLEPKFSNFTSATNQIDGKIGYNFNGGDAMQPVSFLNELRVSTTTTVLPETTTSFFVTSPNLMSGSAVVIARLVFNSSSPVPSEDLVLRAINTLRNSRESKLNESVKVVNVTYEKISETSYAVVFEIRVVNISMPVDQVLRNNTYQEVQKIIVTTLNTLLNEPGSPPLEPKFSNFTSATNQIDGKIGYNFNGGDAMQPVSFLNELRVSTTTTVLPETTTSFFVTSPNLMSGSAVVIARLVFNSSSPVPSEDLVLRAINTLRNSRESKLNESVKVVNVTYEKISETSYAVVFEIRVVNISMPVDQVLRNNTYQEVQKIIVTTLNTLLNEPGSPPLEPKFSNFTSATNQIDGKIGYNFNGGDAMQPVSFLNELRVSTTTTVLPETTTSFFVTSPNLMSGSAVVIARLVFNSSSPVPSEDLVLRAINTLRNSRESKLNESVKVVNVTYEKISETSYAVVFEIRVVNISMPVDQVLRNNTYQEVQKIIVTTLNTLLNEPGSPPLEPKFSNFTSATNQIDGKIGYNFNGGDAMQPVSFLNELRVSTTTTVLPETTTSFLVTSPNLMSGSAVVIARLVFNSSSPVPSEDLVLRAINTLRNSRESKLNESVKVVNVTYEKISETSYAVVFEIRVVNISMPVDQVLRNNTYQEVQKIIVTTLNTLLNEPGSPPLEPKFSNFTSTTNQINGKMGYNFNGGDAMQPVSFLNELRVSTTTTVLPETTTSFFVTSPNLMSGSAVVIARLVFNSSSPVPSEDLVLRAINTLRISRESKLNESMKVVNVTYDKISETSYAVVFEIRVVNISMPVDQVLRNNTYQEVQKIIVTTLNTLLNEPGSPPLEPKFSNFTSATNQIDGKIGYNFNGGDAMQPVSFLNELRVSTMTTVLPETTTSFFVTSTNLMSDSAVVIARLVFNLSSPVPSEDLVLRAINTLRISRESKLNESVKVVNVTYEKISETSYAVVFEIRVVNISMPVDQVLRNNTYQEVQKIIVTTLNTLLNEPGSPPLEPKFSNFTSTTNQIDGKIGYTFNGGDAMQAVSFLNELLVSTTTTVLPGTTTSFFVTSPNLMSGSAVVIARLVFNLSSPVPSEDLVLRAINTLRISRESKLNESVKVVNVTYEKISETSYAVVFEIKVVNISMPVDQVLRNNTYQEVQKIIVTSLNTLLNEPGSPPLEPKFSNFTSATNQIDGKIGYTFNGGDAMQPVSFLNELRVSTTTTVLPETTTSFFVTSPNLMSGSAVVIARLVFNLSSPVPSEDLVLRAINTLRISRESKLNESVKVVNVTYEKISETSYAVVFEIKVVNISMPVDQVLRNNTYQEVQKIIVTSLNTLLNEPGSPPLEPKFSNFTSATSQIDGKIGYNFNDGDAMQPVSFLNELRVSTMTTVLPETTSFSVTSPTLISGSAVVIARLVFNSSSPVPSEDLVLSAISTLRNSRESKLNESLKVVNVTYEKIAATSYAVIFKFNLSNISMSKDPNLRNGTYLQAQGVINNALNTLLNEPGTQTLNPKSTNFISTSNQFDGKMDYIFQDGDVIQPVSFLNKLIPPTVLTTASTLTTTPLIVRGKALIFIRLVFVTLAPLPNPDRVVEVANTLLKTRLATKQDTTTQDLSDSVSLVNVTYTKINETAYALNFGFEISNITMSEKVELRNGTHLLIQDSINSLLCKILLSNSSVPFIKFQEADFTGNSTVIQAKVEYVFSPNDFTQPSIFVQELQLAEVNALTTSTTSPPILIRKAIIKIRLDFITLGPRPSKDNVLEVVKTVLATNLTTKLTVKTVSVSDPVTLENVDYLAINDTAYALIFAFEINKVSLTESSRNEAYKVIQDKTNNLVTQILKDPSVSLLIVPDINDDLTVIEASVTYVFSQYNSNSAAGLLVGTLFKVFTTPVPTVTTTMSNNGTNAAWVVAIIVPCAIIIGLVPCWILLCCLLCGCCAAIRRRWHRRRSYNVQYTTRNSLF
ncbi:uncharacterized threonine-rich GPI-anchored glycoprotein PJ4664.02 isoform X2 [Puntigrus tetrazona]|uniref:uncharacterized threonine-rich GPI-anchored glycoprotein PJ4664.02 isoform X2 n=1 Tax=Puntigrus tetrazona TaxID=1606681 RepID=UPI001C89D1AB|nr:uncharacterized threonine-rich GPI-anchored glycoprotein PJ4664.02 isoform X2 [Puntigrus tetrazona]